MKTLLIKKRSVSAPKYQFTHTGPSLLIQPLLEPFEHNLNQKEPYQMPFSTHAKSRSDHVFKSALDNWTNYRPKNIVPYFTSFYSPKRSFYYRLRLSISSILSERFHSPMAAPQGLPTIFQSKENSHLKVSIQYLGDHFKSI